MHVVAVHSSSRHTFSKYAVSQIEVVEGHGVAGDAHFGQTVKHRSRVAKDAGQPNLRQVHLLHQELLAELEGSGFSVFPGQLGENITTSGIGLLELSAGTQLLLGNDAIIEVTGLRNPCSQIEDFQSGLLSAVLGRWPDGSLLRKPGVMGIVVRGGVVKASDRISVVKEPMTYERLQPV